MRKSCYLHLIRFQRALNQSNLARRELIGLGVPIGSVVIGHDSFLYAACRILTVVTKETVARLV